MTIEEIITRIGYYRNLRNLSARELSLRIDKNEAYINHLESDKFNLKISILLDILQAMDITCEEFFSSNYKDFDEDQEILSLLNHLPLERKKAFIELMKNTK